MPFSLRIRGLIVCVFESGKTRLLLLNAGYDSSLALPHHIPTLVVPKASVKSSTMAALPSLRGRSPVRELEEESPEKIDAENLGWDLSGLTVSITCGSGAPTKVGGVIYDIHPNPDAPDWTALHWVMDIHRFQPGSRLLSDALSPGPLTTAVVDVTGGVAAGGVPANGKDSNWVYYFSPNVVQAVTDTMEWTASYDTTITLTDVRGVRGEIVLTPSGVGYLLNEASAADNKREVDLYKCNNQEGTAPVARHSAGYVSALQLAPGKEPFSPRALYQFMGQEAYEGTFCIILRA